MSGSVAAAHAPERLLSIATDLADGLAQHPGPVLLVDDFVNSRWTITQAAGALRRAGASDVLPLVLAVDG